MHRSFEFRLYPFVDQVLLLDHHLTVLHEFWNYSPGRRADASRKEHRTETYRDQQNLLKTWRKVDPEGLGQLSFAVGMDCLPRVDLAFGGFFRRVRSGEKPGFPRFRSRDDPVRSFTFFPERSPLSPGRGRTHRLKIPRIGPVPIRMHRALPEGAVVKSVTVRKEVDGWFATLAVEVPDPPPPPLSLPERPVGIDLGVSTLATLSAGERVAPPKFFERSARKLARAQRTLARRQKGSGRYERQRRKVAQCHARIRRQRRGRDHQLSLEWVRDHDLVAFEDLDASELVEGNRLARRVLDSGWGQLRSMTRYKAAARSQRCVEVPSAGTTQICSECGRRANPLVTLADRIYSCPCGLVTDRDLNAAKNVLHRGLALVQDEVRRNTPELKRVESGPPPRRVGRRAHQRRRVSSVKREVDARPMAIPAGVAMNVGSPRPES